MAREFAWSYSKLKNYETCPKRHYEVDICRNFSDEGGEALLWGNQVHDAMHKAIPGLAPLPEEMGAYQKWVDYARAKPPLTGAFAFPSLHAYLKDQDQGQLFVEQKYAINRAFEKRPWSGSPDIWYRGIADVANIWGKVGRAIDWKTGKILNDSVQLALMAQCMFSHYPQLDVVLTEFVWLADDCTTPELFFRRNMRDLWLKLGGRVAALENAAKTTTYPPNRGFLCKRHCPVNTCPFWGKGMYDR